MKFQIPHQGMDVRFPSTYQGGERNPKGNSDNKVYIGERTAISNLLFAPFIANTENRSPFILKAVIVDKLKG